MTEVLAEKMANSFIQIGLASQKDQNILRFGFELVLTSAFGIILLLIISILVGSPFSWIAFIIGFAPIRSTAGGYHARSHLNCYILTTVFFTICLFVSHHFI